MAHASTSVTSALPLVGLCAVTLKTGPSIRILDMPSLGGYIVAYDRDSWSRPLIERYVRMYLGDYELVEPATGGA